MHLHSTSMEFHGQVEFEIFFANCQPSVIASSFSSFFTFFFFFLFFLLYIPLQGALQTPLQFALQGALQTPMQSALLWSNGE